jgi:Ran GTPase-activating protein (RanGAP) involved in mRNA processing and transport
MSGAKVFSVEGKGLKLTTAEDIEPHIQDLKTNDQVEEIRFLGNTLGVEASKALADVLEKKKALKVQAHLLHFVCIFNLTDTLDRSQTLPTSSRLVCCRRSHPRFPTS